MSIKALSWAFAQDVGSATYKAVLLALADSSGMHGITVVSPESLQQKANATAEEIGDALAAFELTGLIWRGGQGNKRAVLTGLLKDEYPAGYPAALVMDFHDIFGGVALEILKR